MSIKYTILKWYKQIVNSYYQLITLFSPIRKEKVVFFLYRGSKLEGNLQMVFEELKKQFPSKEIYIQTSAKKVGLAILKDLWLIRDAETVLIDDYFLAGYLVTPRKGTRIIQLWHATGAFKKFGLSTRNTQFGPSEKYLEILPIHQHYTAAYVSTDISAKYFSEAFGMSPTQIFAMGSPRAEQLMCHVAPLPVKFSHQKKNMTKILIAPTYRAGKVHQESLLRWTDEVQEIVKQLPKNTLLIIVLHPYENTQDWTPLMNHPQIYVDLQSSANAWMPHVDAFITDYSSAIFEFALFEKPLAHYIPDLEEYTKNRGFYRPVKEITDGDLLHSRKQLIEWINQRHQHEHLNTERMVRENIGVVSGVTEKIVQHIFEPK